jgi:hypothetical protein
MRALGLSDVRADASFPLADPATAALEIANVQQVRDGLVAQGHATAEEIDEHVAALGEGRLDLRAAARVGVRSPAVGRQPARSTGTSQCSATARARCASPVSSGTGSSASASASAT